MATPVGRRRRCWPLTPACFIAPLPSSYAAASPTRPSIRRWLAKPSRYSSKAVDAAITDMVRTIMGVLPADPRYAELRQIRRTPGGRGQDRGHLGHRRAEVHFVLACQAPTSLPWVCNRGRHAPQPTTSHPQCALWRGLYRAARGRHGPAGLDPPRPATLAGRCLRGTRCGAVCDLGDLGSGDPSNANVPGTYEDTGIAHPLDPAMEPTAMRLSARRTWPPPWATLPQNVLDRACFFHHTTLTNSHANQSKVLKLMSAIKRQEMLVSFMSQKLSGCLDTVQAEPASVSGEFITFGGRVLPALTPTGLRDVFISPAGPLSTLRKQRDTDLDRIYGALKRNGNPTQLAFLDRMARSRGELRNISDSLLNSLSGITANDLKGQITAAVALIQMGVTPTSVIQMPFGGDNHSDANLARETASTSAASRPSPTCRRVSPPPSCRIA